MIIGIYRSDEVSTRHPLHITLSKMKETIKIPLHFVELNNLGTEDINKLVVDTLSTNALESFPLAAYIQKRTNGNAFYVLQYLKFLAEEDFLYFCPKSDSWKWKKIDTTNLVDSVTDFTRKKILKLDKETQRAVIAASCLGFNFSLSDLSLIVNNQTAIQDAIDEGIFVISSSNKKKYRFVHDSTLQAVISLIPSQDRTKLYLNCGQLLWNNAYKQGFNEQETFFVVVCLLNTAIDLITDPDERMEIVKLNLAAGKKALSATAFKPASEYFSIGIKILGSAQWGQNYDLTLELHNTAAEAAYCSNDEEKLKAISLDIFTNARRLQDKMHAYFMHIKSFIDSYKYQDAVKVGLNVLQQLGEELPMQPKEDFVKDKLLEVSGRILEENFDPLLLKTMENRDAFLKMQSLAIIHHAAYHVFPLLCSLIGSKYYIYLRYVIFWSFTILKFFSILH